jgi:hypothetical protein
MRRHLVAASLFGQDWRSGEGKGNTPLFRLARKKEDCPLFAKFAGMSVAQRRFPLCVQQFESVQTPCRSVERDGYATAAAVVGGAEQAVGKIRATVTVGAQRRPGFVGALDDQLARPQDLLDQLGDDAPGVAVGRFQDPLQLAQNDPVYGARRVGGAFAADEGCGTRRLLGVVLDEEASGPSLTKKRMSTLVSSPFTAFRPASGSLDSSLRR